MQALSDFTLLKRGAEVVGLDNLNAYYDVKLKNDRLNQLEPHSGLKDGTGAIAVHKFTRKSVHIMSPAQCLIMIIFFFATIFEGSAYAYTDPGTGFMIWQLLVSAFVGVLFYFRQFFSKLFKRNNKKNDK